MNLLRKMSGMGSRPYPLDKERRRRVMVALAEKDMSISSLARILDIDQSIISKVINGRRISAKTEQRIADYLGKPSDDLFPYRIPAEIEAMRKAEAKENAA